MVDHVGFGVPDYARRAFYEQALPPLGITLLMEPVAQAAGFGRDGNDVEAVCHKPGQAQRCSGFG